MMLTALIEKEFRLLRRDPHSIAVLFIMPAVFILIMSLALRDLFAPPLRDGLSIAIADEDRSIESKRLIDLLDNTDGWTITTIDAAEPGAPALTIPDGFGNRLFVDPADKPRLLLELSITADTQPQITAAIRARLAAGIQQVQGQYLTSVMAEQGEVDPAPYEYSMDPRQWRIDLTHRYSGSATAAVRPTAVQHNTPAWIVFAMFFVVLPLSSGFIVERQQGAFQRLQALAVPPIALIIARFVPYYVINLLQMVVMLLVGRFLVPAVGGELLALDCSWIALWVIGSATSLAAISFSLLLSVIARTTAQATTAGGVANLLFGALGGIMVPKIVMPDGLRALAELSPMSWALDGFLDVLLLRGGVMDTAPEASMLIVFAIACAAAAAWLLNREARNNH